MEQEQKKQYTDITGIDPDELSKSYMKTIAVNLYKAGMLNYFITALSSEESLDQKESCEFTVQSLKDLKSVLNEIELIKAEECKELQKFIDDNIQHCYDMQKDLKE